MVFRFFRPSVLTVTSARLGRFASRICFGYWSDVPTLVNSSDYWWTLVKNGKDASPFGTAKRVNLRRVYSF